MDATCRDSVMRTWKSLLMARQRVLDAVSAEMKAAGLPPLEFCHVLIQLTRTGHERLRPMELERRLELPQYTMSRLLDRMEKAGLIAREACPTDGRSHHVRATPAGRQAMEAIWPVYCAAIERHLGGALCDTNAGMLAELLDRVGAGQRALPALTRPRAPAG
jgi:DNA-binding MarR family transcriptional regulator